jgi:hypothetical protein
VGVHQDARRLMDETRRQNNMNHIPILVLPFSDAVDGSRIDIEQLVFDGDKIQTCYNCGSTLFYVTMRREDKTKLATDTHFICAVCGKDNGGIYNDPLNELNLTLVETVMEIEK